MNDLEQITRSLAKSNFKFKWNDELKLFVVKQYAEFIRAQEICENIIEMFPELCEEDIKDFGEEDFKTYLLRTIYKLTPETIVFPKKFQEFFEVSREEYLKDTKNSYLFHSKNRLQELDNMYDATMNRAVNASDDTEARQLMQLGLNIIKESRAEQSSSKVRIEATSDGKDISITATGAVNEMTNSEIEELIKRHESGESIELPRPKESLPPTGSGEGQAEGEGSEAPRGSDQETGD